MNEERTERLFISYSADGAIIREAVARRKSAGHTYWTASMDSLHTAPLPPPTCIVEVYPVFMQTGRTVRHTLPECLRAAYKPWGGCPDFCYRSVWGASPELASLAFPFLRQVLSVPSALLVIAHGHSFRQQAPEPGIFVSNLSRFLPPPPTKFTFAGLGPAPMLLARKTSSPSSVSVVWLYFPFWPAEECITATICQAELLPHNFLRKSCFSLRWGRS